MGQGKSKTNTKRPQPIAASTPVSGAGIAMSPSGANASPSPPTTTASASVEESPLMDPSTPSSTVRLGDKRKKNGSISSLSKAFRDRKWKRRGSVSASFSLNESDIKVELINVNRATEEELMTLPGVNRTLAKNVVAHRALIGGYRRVEDLALVSGMGASKLVSIRPEITTSSFKATKSLSRASSPSLDSFPAASIASASPSEYSRYRNRPQISVNTATIFDLMSVPGVNQATAARIIHYRDRKGPYKNLDQLRQAGVRSKRVSVIRSHLTVENNGASDNLSVSADSTTSSPPVIRSSVPDNSCVTSANPEEATAEAEEDSDDISSSLFPFSMEDIFELMSLKSSRPNTEFSNTFNNSPAFRLVTWNLENLTKEKIHNPGVLEVITRTILENGLSIVAVQEISDKDALSKICDELNTPVLRKNKDWRRPRGNWTFVLDPAPLHYDKAPHYLGVLYNAHVVEEVVIPETTGFAPVQNGSLWQFGVFTVKMKSCTWILINVLSATSGLNLSSPSYTNGHAHSVSSVTENVRSLIKSNAANGAIICGHFNPTNGPKGLVGDAGDFERIQHSAPDSVNDGNASPIGNMWCTNGVKDLYTGECGTIEEGLRHLAIPNGWSWGGRVTNSAPFWSTFYFPAARKTSPSAPAVVVQDSEASALPLPNPT